MELTHTIVQRVADLEGTDPTELPSLFHSIDAEYLERLIDSANEAAISVRFTYFGYDINVNGEKEVKVKEKNLEVQGRRETDL